MISDPEVIGALAVLAGLRSMSRRRLAMILAVHDPIEALESLRLGRPLVPAVEPRADVRERLRVQSLAVSASRRAARCAEVGVSVTVPGDGDYPPALIDDPERPAVLFLRGDRAVLADRRVGVVGTRNATAAGRATAADLGARLAEAGVSVVSGLARGIDTASHRGVLASGPGRAVAVLGNGPDLAYPRSNRDLLDRLVEQHVVLSEWPPGTPPEAFHFPLRNRVIAALSEVLVVVESRASGGSLITARAALERGVEVMAVPGSPRSPASEGANHLLRDGAAPVTSVNDVLEVLSITPPVRVAPARRPPRSCLAIELFEACRDGPRSLDQLVSGSGAGVAPVASAVAELVRDGWLVDEAGWLEVAVSGLPP
jgi:DNA processing protein